LAAIQPALLEVAADRVVAAGVAVLGHQPPEDLLGGMPLLTRGRLVGRHDGIDDLAEGAEHRGGPRPRPGLADRLGGLQRLENGLGRGMELVGDLADGEAIAMELANAGIVVHRKHPRPPAAAAWPHARAVLRCFPFWCRSCFPWSCRLPFLHSTARRKNRL